MSEKAADIDHLLQLMAALRAPDGCPWDRAQDFDSIAPYTIEETYEVVDAIDRRDWDQLREELGDLLFQVVFHAQMAAEAGHFGFADVVQAISEKLTRRHPHVFGGERVDDTAQLREAWDQHKREERGAAGDHDASALAGVARGLPEWQRAGKLQQRAANTGFDWPAAVPVLDKLAEEVDELRAEMVGEGDTARIAEELGDVLFTCSNLARHTGVDLSRALRHANAKFERRFRAMEALAASEGRDFSGLDADAQERLWQRVKTDGS